MGTTLRLDYGVDGLEFRTERDAVVIEPVHQPAAEPRTALRQALAAPIGTARLRDRVRRGQPVGVAVCDLTRAQPRQVMLEALFEEAPQIDPADVTIFIATGTHRRNTPAEIERMLGREIAGACRVVCHDARDDARLAPVGVTSTGAPVQLNRDWLGMEFKITTGFVEPHFFAGFSGGPKMIAPGLAGLETVMHLHDARRIAHPRATWGVTEGNPVHDDVREIARLAPADFALDVTLNREQQITAAFAGDLLAAHRTACEAVRRSAMRPVAAPFDVVVTTNSGYPLDQNLYQAVKGMSAAARIVKPGGVIVCAAECRDGVPARGAYRELLAAAASPEDLYESIVSGRLRRPDQWQVQIQAQIQRKARVWVRAGGLTDEEIRAAHFEPVADVSAAAEAALRQAGPAATLCVLPRGPQTIPYVAE